MDERTEQFRVGYIMLGVLFIAGILVVLFGEFDVFGRGQYRVRVHFPRAPGVSVDTPVRKHGILIGRVTEIELADEGVITTLTINSRVGNSEVLLRQNEYCRIALSLLGDASLQFEPSGDPRLPDKVVTENELMIGLPASEPLDLISGMEDDITLAIQSISGTSNQVGRLAQSVTDMLENNEEQLARVLSKAEGAIENLNLTVTNANDFLDDPQMKADLKESMAKLPDTIDSVNETIGNLKQTMALADTNLKNMEKFTEPLGQRGEELVSKVDQVVTGANDMVVQLEIFSRSLNNPDGSIGRLVNDQDLYQNLNSAVSNVNQLTKQMRPILDDVRIISDKMARHPGSIVREAVRPASGTKYITNRH
jgi:phospholipid/cholesterol/gamma-HCH transport system substrate-binding protein